MYEYCIPARLKMILTTWCHGAALVMFLLAVWSKGTATASASDVVVAVVGTHGIWDFVEDFGGIPNDVTACQHNTDLLSYVLQCHGSNRTLRIAAVNTTLHFYPGVTANQLQNVVLLVDGTMRFERTEAAVKNSNNRSYNNNNSSDGNGFKGGRSVQCLEIVKSRNVTLKASSSERRGLIDGRGSNYWGIPVIGFLELVEHRPRMVQFSLVSDLLVENLIFQDSPYHTLFMESVQNATVRHVSIVARRTPHDGHSWIDLSAFNTDGIDVSGTNVHIHDVDIWTQDDCIAVKDNPHPPYESTNMLFERVNCSGLGFVVGSIGGTMVRNITFRDSYLHRSVKGIYMKFHTLERAHNRTGLVQDITYENIAMEQPLQWPIWIGPAQQSDERRLCPARPCSLCWPQNPYAECRTVPSTEYRNLTIRNIQINNPIMSPGVLLGGREETHNLIHGVLFDNVRVTRGQPLPQALIDRTVTFPGLLQPVVDHYVPDMEVEIKVLLAAAAAAAAPFNAANAVDSAVVVTAAVDAALRAGRHGPLHATSEGHLDDTTDWSTPQRPHELVAVVVGVHVILCTALVLAACCLFKDRDRGAVPPGSDSRDEGYSAVLASTADQASSTASTPSRSLRLGWLIAAVVFGELVLLLSLSRILVVNLQWGKPKWNRTNRYFRCVGIVHGVATGGTWPVPSCFAQAHSTATTFLDEVTSRRRGGPR